jgi:hypothetical protein
MMDSLEKFLMKNERITSLAHKIELFLPDPGIYWEGIIPAASPSKKTLTEMFIETKVSRIWPGFTLKEAEGYWKGQSEWIYIVEGYVPALDDSLLGDLFWLISEFNNTVPQEAILFAIDGVGYIYSKEN